MIYEDAIAEIRKRLTKAVADNDFREIVRLGRIAQEYESLKGQEKQIGQRKSALIAALGGGNMPKDVDPNLPRIGEKTASPQQRGNSARAAFVQQLSMVNISLRKIGGKRYSTQSGLEVGVAYAAELGVQPDSWFLGLADEHFDVVVLLCKTASGQMLEFVLPPKLVLGIWGVLSRSNGQVKFHVIRKGPTYELRIPGGRLLPVTDYMGKIEAIQ